MSVQVNWLKGRWEFYVRRDGEPGQVALITRSRKTMIENLNAYALKGAKIHHVLVSQ